MRILHALHDFLPRHRAGSEIYVHDLCQAQAARGLQVHVLCAEYDLARPHGSLTWRFFDDLPVTELVNNWTFASFEESYRSVALAAQLEHVLRAVAPDVLHIHNLQGLSLELPAIAAARGIASVATLHEFALVCPAGGQRISLDDAALCRDIDPRRCVRCFPRSPLAAQMAGAWVRRGLPATPRLASLLGALHRRMPAVVVAQAQRRSRGRLLAAEEIERRLEVVRRVYETVALFVSPSRALGEELVRLGLPRNKLRVSDYGFVPLRPLPHRPRGERLVVGYVGTLVPHKGAHVLLEAVRQLPAGRVEVLLFGALSTFPDYVSSLRRAARGLPVRFMDGFDRRQVAEVYAQIDVLVVPSIWPENSPLVIHEAFMAGVPVIGARVGGIPDLVQHGESGLLYEHASPHELAAVLRSLIDDPASLSRLAARPPSVKSMDDDAAGWETIYHDVLRGRA